MSDTALNSIIQYGTAAARAAFTPTPAVGSKVLYVWYDTDAAPATWIWNGAAWVQINLFVPGAGAVTDNALVRFDGVTGRLIQQSVITIADTGAIAFPDGVKQTFNPDGTNPGINVGSQAGNPSTPANGDLWYNSTANTLRARINGVSVDLGAGGGFAEQCVVKAADETVVNNTLQDDNELLLPVVVTSVYLLSMRLIVTNAASGAANFAMRFTLPASATLSFTNYGLDLAGAATGDASPNSGQTAGGFQQGTPTATRNFGTGVGNFTAVWVEGVVRVAGTAGNVTLQWAQQTTDANGTTVKTDSHLSLKKVA